MATRDTVDLVVRLFTKRKAMPLVLVIAAMGRTVAPNSTGSRVVE